MIFTAVHGTTLASALANNTHLKHLNLSNTKLQTQTAIEIAEAMKTNRSLQVLNLEENQVGPAGIKALAEMLKENTSLLELRLAQQRNPFGTEAEQTLMESMQRNETLIRFTGQIRNAPSRNAVDRAITRNKELERKRRQASKEQ
ncbi:hypothetical protein BJ742DRAFT_811792 [Cladochytrium replicatum]|nr:hypothetical protein BJ742DRAFT_811792 [Cladochytrium replicatum]